MVNVAIEGKRLAHVPGPRGLPLLGNLLQVDLPRLHLQLERWAMEHGPIFRLRLGPRTLLCVSDTDTINFVLRERPDLFRRRSVEQQVMREMGFDGVFSQEGDAWRRQRKLVVHALNPAHIARFYPHMITFVERLRQRWLRAARERAVVDMCRDLMRFTVDVTAKIAFGIDVNTIETDGPVIQQHLDKVLPMVYRRVIAPLPWWRLFPSKADRDLRRALRAIHDTVESLVRDAKSRIASDRRLVEHPGNFLEAIIAASEMEGIALSDTDIHANVIVLLLAGEDTTANTLAWATKFLVDYPEHAQRMRLEADGALGEHVVPGALDRVRDLPFCEAFTNETMRHKPVAPVLTAEATRDCELLGFRVPAGTEIFGVPRVAAMSDRYFADGARFDPERWLRAGAGNTGPHDTRAFLPFGAGPRFCPGRGLAMLEVKTVLAMLVRNFDLAMADPGQAVTERQAFTMHPENLFVRLSVREK